MTKSLLIQAWALQKKDNKFYLPYTHWIYLNEIVKFYDRVCLISPVNSNNETVVDSLVDIGGFNNVVVKSLPFSNTYINSLKNFFYYVKAYKALRDYQVVYARYPTPFGWLQKVFLKKSTRIIHFVGDPLDAAENNPNFSKIKKIVLKTFFKPEHALYLWACKGAKVFTNGYHLSERLSKNGIQATPLVSSTLSNEDFCFDAAKVIDKSHPKLLYIGYLRKAKGVETVIISYKLLREKYPGASLTIVGSGEFENGLKQIVENQKISGVEFLGHIDDRTKLNEIFRKHDIFSFGSLSEGSPRVILEAMANGLNVVSTPVGALPFIFKDKEEIVFAKYSDPSSFSNCYDFLISNSSMAYGLRYSAFQKVKDFTVQKFLKRIFGEN